MKTVPIASRATYPSRPSWTWISVGAAWVPIWALYAALVAVAHPGTSTLAAAAAALRIVGPAALLGIAVRRFVQRYPWPGRFTAAFAGRQILAALTYSLLVYMISDALEWATRHRHALPLGDRAAAILVFGLWLYIMVASLSYAIDSTERAGSAAAMTAQTRLAVLRAQLQPHFLFNALHAVVHLIPLDPKKAADAAQRVAILLRISIEEGRDLIPLSDERAFVEEYLALEQLRCGDRLIVTVDIDAAVNDALVPSFALQTLVENAIRHGVAPQVAPTHVTISAIRTPTSLLLRVSDTGPGAAPDYLEAGTGLRRLKERLSAMYGVDAGLQVKTSPDEGFEATLHVPWDDDGREP
ncbi:MAG: sensor protein lytS [Gemmatimonadetes bacterium]|nr:sensor protein lytS [Gemmatimonadota bacterium]